MPELLALHGGSPVRKKPFPSWPVFEAAEERALTDALRSGAWGRMDGQEVARFERRFAEYHEAAHGIAVVNGTVALRLALMAAGIEAGEEVIVPPYTFVATASAVVEANAVPMFADLGTDTFNIDPRCVEAEITPRTRAIIPVHFAGLPADLEALRAIARRHELVVIEDACHAHGAGYKGRRVGAIGDLGVFSFQSTKNLTCGEGGIILTNDAKFADQCRSLHNCGRVAGGAWHEHHRIGGNYRLSEFQGAVLNAQWNRFEEQAETRERNGVYLAQRLAALPGVYPQARSSDCTRHGYHLFAIRIDPAVLDISRALLLRALAAEGIPASAGYAVPLYRQPVFEGLVFGPYSGYRAARPDLDYRTASCPTCEALCSAQAVWLEQRLLLGALQDMEDVARAFEKVYEHRAHLAAEEGCRDGSSGPPA